MLENIWVREEIIDIISILDSNKGTTIKLERGGEGLCFFSKKNILIPNVAENNILILVEEKKIF